MDTTTDAPHTATHVKLAALAYGAKGIRVFPVAQDRKAPCIARNDAPAFQELDDLAPWQTPGKGGQHTAHSAEMAIRSMWMCYSDARIGCALEPGTVVIDLDDDRLLRHHPDLHQLLEDADTFVVQARRGRHYYFTLPEGLVLTQSVGSHNTRLPAEHPRCLVDLKVGGAGWAILPPSDPYTHVRGEIDDLAILPPEWVDTLTDDGPAVSEVPDGEHAALRPSTFTSGGGATVPDTSSGKLPEGTARHPILLAQAGKLRQQGLDRAEIEAVLLSLNERLFEVPKDPALVRTLARDAAERYEAGTLDVEPGPTPERETPPAPAPEPPELEETDDGLAEALQRAGWELRWNTRGHRAEARRIGSEEWLYASDDVIDDVMNDASKVAIVRRGHVLEPFGIRGVRKERRLWGVVARRRCEAGDGGAIYDAVFVWAVVQRGRRMVLGEILTECGVLNRYESGVRSPQYVEQAAKRALREAGWTYHESLRRPGVRYPAPGWQSPA